MFLDWLTLLVQANGVVTSAIMLALLSFAIKFGFYRKFDQIDVMVAISEVPTVLSAACGSLLVAALYLPSRDARLVAMYLMISFFVLLYNLFCYRLIETRKLNLNENKVANVLAIMLSYFLMVVFSLAAATRAYGELAL